MNAEDMLGSLIRGALGGKRKRSKGAMRYLAGGKGSLINASTLLAAAGVAWGLYETATRNSTVPGGGAGAPVPPGGAPPGTPVPVPTHAVPPPLPNAAAPAPSAESPVPGVPPQVLRVIRLTISAARADGTLSEHERAAILQQARAVGAETVVQPELDRPTPLPALLAGVDPAQRRDLYALAFAIVRADESISGAERIYLAQLAHQLGLEPADVASIESEAAARIQAAAGESA